MGIDAWTADKPNASGWYWTRARPNAMATILYFDGRSFGRMDKKLATTFREYVGPLSPDSFQQGRVAGLREAIQRADEMGNQSSSSHVRSVVGLIVMDLREKLAQQAQEGGGL